MQPENIELGEIRMEPAQQPPLWRRIIKGRMVILRSIFVFVALISFGCTLGIYLHAHLTLPANSTELAQVQAKFSKSLTNLVSILAVVDETSLRSAAECQEVEWQTTTTYSETSTPTATPKVASEEYGHY